MSRLHRLVAEQKTHERIGDEVERGDRLFENLLALPVTLIARQTVAVQDCHGRIAALFAPQAVRRLELLMGRELVAPGRQRTRQCPTDEPYPLGDVRLHAGCRTVRVDDSFSIERHRDLLEVFRVKLRVLWQRHDQAMRGDDFAAGHLRRYAKHQSQRHRRQQGSLGVGGHPVDVSEVV